MNAALVHFIAAVMIAGLAVSSWHGAENRFRRNLETGAVLPLIAALFLWFSALGLGYLSLLVLVN